MRVQLLTFPGCPNAEAAREVLRRSLDAEGLTAAIEQIDITSPQTPEHLRRWGSPTILIGGADVTGMAPAGGATCRLYQGSEGPRGVPEERTIREAIRRAGNLRRSWLGSLALLPGAMLPLLPSATCPACLVAYAGLASAVGLGFLLNERVLAPLVVVALLGSLASLAWSAKAHRRKGPVTAGLLASAAVVSGRLIWSVPGLVYAGIALFVGAAAWNLWLGRARPAPLIQLRSLHKEGGLR